MTKYLVGEEGPLKGITFTIEDKDQYIIGRDIDQVDILLEDNTVSRKHAILTKEADGYVIQDLSNTNPILVNDSTISEPHLLKENDKIKIGKSTFLFTQKAPEQPEQIEEEAIHPSEEEEQKEEQPLQSPEMAPEDEISSEEPAEEPQSEEPQPEEPQIEEPKAEKENFEAIQTPEEPSVDTIFEEETEEEPTFDLIPEGSLILKVITGPNAGAEFPMQMGKEYIIGKDPNLCDIVFNDLSVSKQHAKISVDNENKVYIEDLGSKNGVLINSIKIEQKENITTKDLMLLGTTSFIILDLKEAQETFYTPPPIVEREEKIAEEKEEVEWKKRVIPYKYILAAGSFCLVLFIMIMSFFSLFKSKTIEVAKKVPTEEIKKAVEKFSDVQFSFNPSTGKLFLLGHVLTNIDAQELKYNIANIPFIESVENNVIIDEYVWKNINDILNVNPAFRSVNIHSPKAGTFMVNGYLATPNDAQNLSDYLNANFPYVDKLVYNVVVENVLRAQIEGAIFTKGFSAINYQLTNGDVILAGRYSYKDSSAFESLVKEIKKLNGIRSVKEIAIKTTPEMARVDLSSQYKISGYIADEDKKVVSVIANNKIINIGSNLDGMKITEIKPNTIYLEKDGLKYKIDYIQ